MVELLKVDRMQVPDSMEIKILIGNIEIIMNSSIILISAYAAGTSDDNIVDFETTEHRKDL